MRAHEEAKYSRIWVHFFGHVEYSHDYIVTSSSLSTTEHETKL